MALSGKGSTGESDDQAPESVSANVPAPSLSTLAAHLGLSPAAISRVLSGAPAARSIPKVTQDRIFAAAKQFRYRPNAAARSLRHGRSRTVGVLVPELSEGYTTLVLNGIEERLLEDGYVYFLLSHHHREATIAQAQSLLLDRSVEGIIAVDTPLREAAPVPTVTVSCPDKQHGILDVVLNHRLAGELAIGHLYALGHRAVAVIKGQVFSSDTEPRWRGIRRAATAAGLKLHPQLVGALEGDAPTHEPGYQATRRLIATGESFTALLAFNDISAIGAVRALREAGRRVPEDCSVVGFDDVQSAAFQNPALTTVRQPLKSMGRLAADAVLRDIGMPGATPVDRLPHAELVVDPELIVRESTSPPGELV